MFFDTIAIAKHLNTTPKTVSSWCKAGIINARKVGGIWVIPYHPLMLASVPTKTTGGRGKSRRSRKK